jgi:hypothetical protein
MLAEHLRRANGQRRIKKDWRGRYVTAVHQIDEVDDQLLRPLDCKCRNKKRAACRMGIAHFGGEMLATRFPGHGRAIIVAICRLGYNVVEARRRFWFRLKQLCIGTNISRCQNKQRLPGKSFIGEFEFNGRGAQQMACIPIPRAHAGHDLKPRFVFDRLESVERGNSVSLRVNRTDFRASPRRIAPVQHRNLCFLDASGIRQHE